ncbi:MAG: hypothetical protein V3V45_05795 [Candidatus Brocadiales bacterium]
MEALILSAIGIGFVHSLAPDHWLPFATIARAQGWSRRKLMVVSLLAGVAHVGSSVVLGALGIFLGLGLFRLGGAESLRGSIAGFMLIGFGVAYALWGLKHLRHNHLHMDDTKKVTVWALIAIFIFGPCEPLIPLMFLAVQHGWYGVWLTATAFSLITVFMIVAQSVLAFKGMELLPGKRMEQWSHVMAGGIIALTGVAIMYIGI